VTDIRIELTDHGWDRFDEVLDLYYDVLYGPFGVARDAEWYHPAHGSTFALALGASGELVGSARLLPEAGDELRQVRQVVVAPSAHGRGIGRELMSAIEHVAAEQGADELWLNARHTAFGFYEALGWRFSGESFVSELTGIPHREMRKRVG
jgi:predicted GNAT family N-acyltransferase